MIYDIKIMFGIGFFCLWGIKSTALKMQSNHRLTLSMSATVIKTSKLRDLSQPKFPDVPEGGYDLVVLGSGPGGETAAVRARQLTARVAVVEVKSVFGGPTGLTSKAVREATKQIVQAVDRVGGDRRRQIRRLWQRNFPALRGEAESLQAAETRDKLARYDVDLFIGAAELVPPEMSMSGMLSVRVCRPTGCIEIPTSKVCIATGSRAHRPSELNPGVPLPFMKNIIIDSTEMGKISELPNSVAIIGGGVIAVEYATVLAKLGVGVSLLCQEKDFMPFLESDMRAALRSRMSRQHVLFIDSMVERVVINEDQTAQVILQAKPRQPKQFKVDMVLYSGGRDANSESLNCPLLGVEIGKFGRIVVDLQGRTTNPNVYAVGDVAGGGLASQAAQQGRAVADLLFMNRYLGKANAILQRSTPMEDVLDDDFFTQNEDAEFEESSEIDDKSSLFGSKVGISAPLTLWTIPEIASVGASEDHLENDSNRTHVCGFAYFKDLARGRLSGDPDGFLKIIAIAERPGHHVVIGVHIMGEGANELIQLGSVLVNSCATLEQLANTPFAAVTLSALYQVASDDALSMSPFNLRR